MMMNHQILRVADVVVVHLSHCLRSLAHGEAAITPSVAAAMGRNCWDAERGRRGGGSNSSRLSRLRRRLLFFCLEDVWTFLRRACPVTGLSLKTKNRIIVPADRTGTEDCTAELGWLDPSRAKGAWVSLVPWGQPPTGPWPVRMSQAVP